LVATDIFTPIDSVYTLFTASNLFDLNVDFLVIDMGAGSSGPIHIDDITLNTTSVPEPASLVLLCLGLAGFSFSRKNKTI